MTAETPAPRAKLPKTSFLRNLEDEIEAFGGSVKEALTIESLMEAAVEGNSKHMDSILT
jgi:hypothetical protein